MGKVTVPEAEYLLRAVDPGGTGEVRPHFVPFLVLGQYFIYDDADQFTGFIAEPEPHRRDLTICVGTGNHLYRHVNAQDAFQK